MDFFQTGMGRKFYEGSVPRIARALESIAQSLEALTKEQKKADNLPFDFYACSDPEYPEFYIDTKGENSVPIVTIKHDGKGTPTAVYVWDDPMQDDYSHRIELVHPKRQKGGFKAQGPPMETKTATCSNCQKETTGRVYEDDLGPHMVCSHCKMSFDV